MNSDMVIALVKVIIFLPLVTALAYFLIKYGLARQSPVFGGKRSMRLVEQVALSPKSYISLVEVGTRYILLAHSENGFQVIREMEEIPEPILQQDMKPVSIKALYKNIKVTLGENPLLGKLFFRKGKER